MSRIEITKSMFGGYRVRYNCPDCGDRLHSPLADAGTQDACPNCNTQFLVPGKKQLDQLNRRKRAELKHKRQIAEQNRELKQKKQREKTEARFRAEKEAELRRQQEIQRQQLKAAEEPAKPPPEPPAEIKCPVCESTQVTANKKGFGLGKAAVGGLLLGPLGLLGGVIGSGKVKITCLACGHEFKPGQGAR
jgi:tellurium resistance protein TerD